jgi:hypothetical protein
MHGWQNHNNTVVIIRVAVEHYNWVLMLAIYTGWKAENIGKGMKIAAT